ncbi:MAG: hypothetical protein RBR15_17775 [Sphaerochaeta sp.]|nr:hypothetical protein [Sphaerochaeta sp.]
MKLAPEKPYTNASTTAMKTVPMRTRRWQSWGREVVCPLTEGKSKSVPLRTQKAVSLL